MHIYSLQQAKHILDKTSGDDLEMQDDLKLVPEQAFSEDNWEAAARTAAGKQGGRMPESPARDDGGRHDPKIQVPQKDYEWKPKETRSEARRVLKKLSTEMDEPMQPTQPEASASSSSGVKRNVEGREVSGGEVMFSPRAQLAEDLQKTRL